MAAPKYVPGVCNIGPGQIRVRLIFGMLGTGITLVMWTLLDALDAPVAWYWLLTAPAAAAALGFLQARSRFCADFGFRGVFNMDPAITGMDTPVQAKYRAQDQQKALHILFYSVVLGALAAALAVGVTYLR